MFTCAADSIRDTDSALQLNSASNVAFFRRGYVSFSGAYPITFFFRVALFYLDKFLEAKSAFERAGQLGYTYALELTSAGHE